MTSQNQSGVFLSDRSKNRVLFIPDDDHPATVVLEHGLKDPYGLCMTSAGALIIADKMHHRLLRVTSDIRRVSTLDATNQRKTPFNQRQHFPWCPTSICPETLGTWLVAYSEDHAIYRIHSNGALELVVGIDAGKHIRYSGCPEHVSPSDVHRIALQQPTSVVIGEDGSIVFVERRFQCIRRYHPSTGSTCLFPVNNAENWEPHRISGRLLPDIIPCSLYHPSYPVALLITRDNELLIADAAQRCIWNFQGDHLQCIYRSAGGMRGGPSGMTNGADGLVWVFDYSTSKLVGIRKSNQMNWLVEFEKASGIVTNGRPTEGTGMAWGQAPEYVLKKARSLQFKAMRN